MIPENIYLHIFNLLPNFGPGRLIKLIQRFPKASEAFHASPPELLQAGLEKELVEKFVTLRASINIENEMEKLQSEQIQLLSIYDTAVYPELLKEIVNAPALLYYKGIMQTPAELCIAVVGTRKISNYGRIITPLLINPIIQAGATIVSGLAFGVDALAQTLATQQGKRTIAVLGGGLDNKSFYPKEHQLLADEILANGGAILSEYPAGTPPLKHHFIARNRILSGISIATLIIECNLKSGSLITAKYALEQNRNVYAVPGPIYAETSKGPNNLIKMGAHLVTEAADILQDLNLKTFPDQWQSQNQLGDTPLEAAILQTLTFEPISVNTLIQTLSSDAGTVTSALTFLEMKGQVKNLGGQQYIKTR